MFKDGFVLRKYSHFDAAMHQKLHVIPYQDGEPLDAGGPIEHHDIHKATINGMHYIKAACEFKIR
jgi:hypothetical protein